MIQVEGMEHSRMKLLLNHASAGASAAADFQNPGRRGNPGHPLDPPDDEVLHRDADGAVDHQAFGPIDLHGFTPR